jgi:AraC-like DNA-binding protein
VVEGAYGEAGDAGRYEVAAGDVLFHRDYEAHCNAIAARGATVINLTLPQSTVLPAAFTVADPDQLLRLDNRDEAAVTSLLVPVQAIEPRCEDWPDLLAADLRSGSVLHLGQWGRAHGISPETVSRGFRKIYGTTAVTFRAEVRARVALDAIRSTTIPFAALACDLGFADQAHMSRAVRALTSASPQIWRKVNSLQE